MRIGEKYRITPEKYGDRGDAAARVGRRNVFISGGIVGEEVEIEIVYTRSRLARGKILKIPQPSLQRVEPECKYFSECGGCQYQPPHSARISGHVDLLSPSPPAGRLQ